jgi:hypothetical protein
VNAGKQVVSLMLRPNKADLTKVDLDTQNKSFDKDYGKSVSYTLCSLATEPLNWLACYSSRKSLVET